jgi:hypothetical protein
VSDYNASRIKKPRFFKLTAIDEINSKARVVIGFDSEADTTSQGKPMMFQFSLPGTTEEETITTVIDPDKPYAGLIVFMDFLEKYCADRDKKYLIYVWNLSYELTQIFHDLPAKVRASEHMKLHPHPYEGWEIDIINSKRQILRFNKGKNRHNSVLVLDGKAFYNTSLNRAAQMLGLGEKFTMSEHLSRTRFTRDDLTDPEFLLYAKRDAFITRRIGEYITQQHVAFNIQTTVSAPHFASTIFKTHFLKNDLANIGPDLEQAGLYSYHGGKNGFYLDGPHEFPDIYFYDITSAYPEAMRQLPDLDNSGWKRVRKYVPGTHALYCVSGYYNSCRYRGIQNHDGKWTPTGPVENLWITSYELDAMMERDEFTIESITGHQMIGSEGGALADYVDKFFLVKRHTKGPERETAKLLLNSLYGKFFQKQPLGSVGVYDLDNRQWVVSDPTLDYDFEAGGLYHPPIASLITGFVRARIHGLEHKYGAVMTSTDGMFGFNPPDPSDLGKDLGKLSTVRGRLRIWRERLYIFDGIDGDTKYALHGFRGSVDHNAECPSGAHAPHTLLEIPLVRGSYRYSGKQMITLKLANNKHENEYYEPGSFVTLPYVINI